MTAASTLVALVLVLVAVVWIAGRLATTTVVEYERGVKFTKGRLKGVLGPGVYRHLRGTTVVHRVDTRPSRIVIGGQEVLSADGVAIKASIVATTRIVDAEEDLLRQRGEIPAELKKAAAPALAAIGIELQDASLRDLTFPGDLKKIFAQVVKARQEGLAALEKARGETAALRNLANAASLVERNPSLMQLRALQALAQQPGNTLVLGVQQGAPMIPLRGRSAPELPPEPPPAADE
jgi:regulator of protease activity HflC (stomatin/prohibitin superfamily)